MYIDHELVTYELQRQELEREVLAAAEQLFIDLKDEHIEMTSSLRVAKTLSRLANATISLKEFK